MFSFKLNKLICFVFVKIITQLVILQLRGYLIINRLNKLIDLVLKINLYSTGN